MIAYFSGMYSRAAKMADGRFVVVDGVVIDNPNAWDQLVRDETLLTKTDCRRKIENKYALIKLTI